MKTQLQIKISIYAIFLLIAEITFSQPTLLKDINLGAKSSMDYGSFLKIGDKLIFTADDGVHGREGWITDGTPTGTIRMEDNTENFIDTLYTTGYGTFLYKTNGTKIDYVFANLGFAGTSRTTKVNETWFFLANIDSNNMQELWKSDGTETGTVLVKKTRPNSDKNSYTSNLLPSPDGNSLLFTSDDGSGIALWKSDGTTEGTIKVKSFSNSKHFNIGNFVNLNDQTFFFALNSDDYPSLWKTDGTAEGTVVVYDKIQCNLSPTYISVYKDKIYFAGYKQEIPTEYGGELWVSDGTTEGTQLLFDTNPGPNSSSISGFNVVNNLLVFLATPDLYGQELWVTNGSPEGTFMLQDVYPGPESGFLIASPIKKLNKLFFTGNDGNQRMLWETDGTKSGTIPLYDISESDLLMYSTAGYINNKLIFNKETIAFGNELWSFNPKLSVDKVQDIKKVNIYPNPVSNILTIDNPFLGNIQLNVFNQLGQMVLKQNQSASSTSLDVSNLSKGLYFLNIEAEVGKSQTIKFIKD